MTWLNRWLAEFPTTQARVAFTLVVVFGTAIRYLAFGVPYHETAQAIPVVDGWTAWLTFLAVISGADVAALGVKRFSDTGYVAAKNANNQPDISVGGSASVTVSAAPSAAPAPVTPGATAPLVAPLNVAPTHSLARGESGE